MPRKRATVESERRYAGLSAVERRAGRRERLIQSAIEHYGTAGFRSTTIPELCRTAGVTARHFYEDFPTQETLLTAAYDRIASEMIEQIRVALEYDPARSPYEAYRDGVDAFFTYVTSDKRRARIFALEVIGVGPDLDRHRLAMRDRFVTIAVANAASLGYGGGDLDIRLLSLALVGVTDVLLLEWLLARRRHSVATMVDLVATIWTRALQQQHASDAKRIAPGVRRSGPAAKKSAAKKPAAARAKAGVARGSAASKRKPRA